MKQLASENKVEAKIMIGISFYSQIETKIYNTPIIQKNIFSQHKSYNFF